MGRRGPRPQPSALRVLRGNPGHRRLNPEEPRLSPPSSLDPPEALRGAGLAEWKGLAAELVEQGVLTVADMATFRTYCETLTDVRALEARKDRLDDIGPLVKLRHQLRQLAAELGLTPSSRSSVKRAAKAPKTKLEAFIGGKHGR
jgi:phage terminase small subunit